MAEPSHPPAFTIVMATYARGRHIRPSLESVLRQDFEDYELLVVSDGPDAGDTRAEVERLASPKVRWIEMPAHGGSQAFPNNRGIAASSGRWVAYLGHDDIWSRRHLGGLARVLSSPAAPDVAVSGCLFHAPSGSRMAWVTGLFEDDGTAYFFPPSSLAHRREALALIGGWRDPATIAPPVDDDMLLRFAAAGRRFASTGEVTVHKFTAGHRYLSYLQPGSDEQAAMLRDPRLDEPGAWEDELALARANDGYMSPRGTTYAGIAPGEIFARSKQNRGLALARPRPLERREIVHQDRGARALDWHPLEAAAMPFRWSGPNPRPKILIPFVRDGLARVTLRVVEYHGPLSEITARAGGAALPVSVRDVAGEMSLCMTLALRSAEHTVIELTTPSMFRPTDDRADAPRLGIAVGDIVVEPV